MKGTRKGRPPTGGPAVAPKIKAPTSVEKLNLWLKRVEEQGSTELLFQFETFTRGVRAFFDLGNSYDPAASQPDLLDRSFAAELVIVHQALRRIESLAKDIVQLSSDSISGIESHLEDKGSRDSDVESAVGRIGDQPNPADSFLRMIESTQDLASLLALIHDSRRQDLKAYLCVRRLFLRELRSCKYLEILLSQRFRPQYDRVDKTELSSLLKGIEDNRLRHTVAVCFLYLFRSLRYIDLIFQGLEADMPMPAYLVVLALVRQEISAFAGFIKARILDSDGITAEVQQAADLIFFSIRTEIKRSRGKDIVALVQAGDARSLRAAVSDDCGMLQNCLQGCVITLTKSLDAGFDAEVVFPAIKAKAETSLLLREDLWALRKFIKDALKAASDPSIEVTIEQVSRFRERSMRSLLYRDHENFERFCDDLFSATDKVAVRLLLRQFVGYLENLVQEVSNRRTARGADPLPGQ
jgi:hypothetical protein